jgi:cysteine desulfurase/selenocysteine lyase
MNKPVENMAISAARAEFPALEQWTYMDVAARGVLSRRVRAAIDAYLDDTMLNGVTSKEDLFALVQKVRGAFADLIGAAAGEVAYTKNISEGLNMIATAIDWHRGDNVVLCPELEHPNNVYPWLNLQRYGVEVRMVAPRDAHVPIDDMIDRIDARTRLVTVSTVTFAPGFRTDVARLGKACRERDVLLLVDAAQSVGILRTSVAQTNIDALAVSTQKGLLGPYGMGFLYCRGEWAERLHPAYLARFGVEVGDAHEASIGSYDFKLASGARRFDLGNYNFLATTALDMSIRQLALWDPINIEPHVVALSHALARGFLELGLPVAGGEPGPHLAHIVTVGSLSANHYGTGDERFNRLYEHLVANRVKLSIRRGMLRFSMHVYNNMDDVERVLALTRDFLRKS